MDKYFIVTDIITVNYKIPECPANIHVGVYHGKPSKEVKITYLGRLSLVTIKRQSGSATPGKKCGFFWPLMAMDSAIAACC